MAREVVITESDPSWRINLQVCAKFHNNRVANNLSPSTRLLVTNQEGVKSGIVDEAKAKGIPTVIVTGDYLLAEELKNQGRNVVYKGSRSIFEEVDAIFENS